MFRLVKVTEFKLVKLEASSMVIDPPKVRDL